MTGIASKEPGTAIPFGSRDTTGVASPRSCCEELPPCPTEPSPAAPRRSHCWPRLRPSVVVAVITSAITPLGRGKSHRTGAPAAAESSESVWETQLRRHRGLGRTGQREELQAPLTLPQRTARGCPVPCARQTDVSEPRAEHSALSELSAPARSSTARPSAPQQNGGPADHPPLPAAAGAVTAT